MDDGSIPRQSEGEERPAITDLVERLSHFDGPPEQFLFNLLAVQCYITGAEGGTILRTGRAGQPEVIAVYPPLEKGGTAPVWLAQSVESSLQVFATGTTAIASLYSPEELYGQPPSRHIVLMALRAGGGIRGVAAFVVKAGDNATLLASRERLELTASLLTFYEMRLTLQQRQFDLNRLKVAMETLSAVNERERFASAAMTLCNEIASRWQCERVSLGFLKGRYVQLRAMSHTEKINRKMKLIQDIESAMEECIDQDVEILHPAPTDATYISRAAAELSRHHGPMAILSLPLRKGEEPIAVLTVERPLDNPFSVEEIEALRLTCDLSIPRITNLYEHDRWIGAKAAGGTRQALAAAVGTKHTWIKVLVVLILAAVLFIALAKTDYNASAPFALEATEQQVVPAPFDSYIKTVNVDPGDTVEKGKVLATLETSELELELAAAKADQLSYLKQAAAAMREGKTVDAQIAQAEADKVAAQVKLFEQRIAQAEITSLISGRVISGDLKKQIGAPVKTGDVLFEVAPIESLRAELSVPEDQIADVRVGQKGELATASYPAQRIEFVVERINPVAEVVNQKNVFKVRVRLLNTYQWMRPGMEGEAKVRIDQRSYAWIWTRRLVNWLRMELWL
jgi:biotin carboxyl carrier protein